MKILRSVNDIGNNLNVILRLDTDLPIKDNRILDNSRLVKSLPTIKLLLERKNKIIIIGHRGRPEGKINPQLSLKMVYLELMDLLEIGDQNIVENIFIDNIKNQQKIDSALINNQIIFLENLRFWTEEESGDMSLFGGFINNCQSFVNDAFAVAHRKNASVMLFKEIPAYYGLSFVEETENIYHILNNPLRPITVILGGAKEDKLNYLKDLANMADYILVGGKLPKLDRGSSVVDDRLKSKIIWAELKEDGLDLSEDDINRFKQIISNSKTIVWSGAMGYFEDGQNKKGTEELARYISNTNAYKIIAGGDAGASIVNLGLQDKIDYISSGGGVLLEFLTKGSLPAWE